MKTFNTSVPNIVKEHYTLRRQNIIKQGIDLVSRKRYFTIRAPRQTGKSTYFRLLAGEFLHSIRNAYYSRERHCLKSVLLVGVSNITGIVQYLNYNILLLY